MFSQNLTFKHSVCAAFFVALVTGYANVHAESAEPAAHEEHHAQKGVDWPGIYNGFLPCDDCAGVKTSLALNKNGSYVMITQFTGKSPRDYVEKGKFAPGEKENTIVLTPRNKGAEPHIYLVAEDAMITLDKKGNRFSGKDAERYVLRRTDVASEPKEQHAGH